MNPIFFTIVTFFFLFSFSNAIRLQDFFAVETDNPQLFSNGQDSTAHHLRHEVDFTELSNKIQVSDKAGQIENRLNNRSPSTPVRCNNMNPAQLINLVKALRTGQPGWVDPAVFEVLLSKKADDGPVTEVLKQILMRRFRSGDVARGDRLSFNRLRIAGSRPRQHRDDRRVEIKRENETSEKHEGDFMVKIRKFLAYF